MRQIPRKFLGVKCPRLELQLSDVGSKKQPLCLQVFTPLIQLSSSKGAQILLTVLNPFAIVLS